MLCTLPIILLSYGLLAAATKIGPERRSVTSATSTTSTTSATSAAMISYWRPAGQFIINPDDLQNKAGFVIGGTTAAIMWGTAMLSANATAPALLGDMVFYQTQGKTTYMTEALAIVDKSGYPVEMLDMLDCKFTDAATAPCTLFDWQGNENGQFKRTTLSASITSVSATGGNAGQCNSWAYFVSTAVGGNAKRSLPGGREELKGRAVQQRQDEALAKRARSAPSAMLPKRTAAPARLH